MFKKGGADTDQTIDWVIVVGGAVVVLIAMGAIYALLSEQDDKEVCRLSVLERATVPSFAQQAVGLECTPEKICITTDKKEKCKQFAGEKNIRYVEIDMPKDNSERELGKFKKAKETIEMEAANAMYDCWKMTGEGKLDIFTSRDGSVAQLAIDKVTDYASSGAMPKCIVCSRVAISDALYKKDEELKKSSVGTSGLQTSPGQGVLEQVNVNDYMGRTKIKGTTLTYLAVFTGDKNIGGYGDFGVTENTDGQKTFAFANQIAFVFMQIRVTDISPEKSYWNNLKNNLIVGGVGMLTGPGALIKAVSGPIGFMIGWASVGATSHNFAAKTESNVKSSQLIAAASCSDFESTLPDAIGCSIVKGVQWEDINSINKLCSGGIEGNL